MGPIMPESGDQQPLTPYFKECYDYQRIQNIIK